MINVAVFVSGGGTNLENLITRFKGSERIGIKLVISSSAQAYAVQRAHNHGIPCVVLTKEACNDRKKMMAMMEQFGIRFIVLAGYLRVIPDFLIDAFPGRLINLHPALLPKFGGMGMYGHHVHEAVKAAGETETGMTVHHVSNVVDGGSIIAQFSTPILPTDTAEEIAEKEHVLEMEHFADVVEEVIKGLPEY